MGAVRKGAVTARAEGESAIIDVMATGSAGAPPVVELSTSPGHLIRRAQQVHAGYFAAELGGELTGPQYGVLATLALYPNIDQRQLSELVSLDKNTAADVAARLERRGWLERIRDPGDARRRLLQLTSPARVALHHITPRVARVQQHLLGPLQQPERDIFIHHLARVAYHGNPPDPLPPAVRHADD